jgi:membrane fusion protein (multidrug efflux system)
MKMRVGAGLVVIGLVALVVFRVVRATSGTEAAPDVNAIRQRTGIPVEVAAARVGELVVRREFTGTLRGIRSATVRAKSGDEIVDILVRVGQRVRAGDVLLRQSSQGSLASVEQAQAAREQAQRTVDRLRPLKERGAISDQDWDNALTALRVAETTLDAARGKVDLKSPIDGVVTDILMTRGSVPETGNPLMRVSDLSRLQVMLDVSAEQARELAVGQPALLPEIGLAGSVSRIALQADPASRLLEVELTFPGAPLRTGVDVVPGTLVPVEIEVGRRPDALLVPEAAAQDSLLWVVDSAGVARRRAVRLGLAGDGWVEVRQGLAPGERVVTAGASLLSDGAQTRIVGASAS